MVGVSGGSKVTFRNSTGDTGLEPFILWLADYGTAPAPSWARVDSRDSVLAAVPAQHFLDWIHPRCGFEELCPGLEQGFHDGGIVASPAMPAVLGTVRRPAEWRGVEVVLGIFQRGIRSEQGLDQSEIAVPGGPVQWCPAVLPTGRHRQASFEHQKGCLRVIVARGLGNLVAIGFGQMLRDVGMLGTQGGIGSLILAFSSGWRSSRWRARLASPAWIASMSWSPLGRSGAAAFLWTRRESNKKSPTGARDAPGAALARPLRPLASRGKSVAQFSNTRIYGARG